MEGRKSRLDCGKIEHVYTIRETIEDEITDFAISHNGKEVFALRGDSDALFRMLHDPVCGSPLMSFAPYSSQGSKDVCSNGAKFGSFVREVWREAGGKDFKFSPELFDVCFQNFLLYGESSMQIEVVGLGSDSDVSMTTAVVRIVDEAEFSKLLEHDVKDEGFGVEAGSDFMAIDVVAILRSGKKFDKKLVFELRSNDGDE